jgi:hypothetical protein
VPPGYDIAVVSSTVCLTAGGWTDLPPLSTFPFAPAQIAALAGNPARLQFP